MLNLNNNNINHNILVIGDVMLDTYWFCNSKNLAQEAPTPILEIETTSSKLGGAANVVLNIKKLLSDKLNNTQVSILGCIGDDPSGQYIRQVLSDAQINQYWLEANKTITKQRLASSKQQILRVDFEEQYPSISLDSIINNADQRCVRDILNNYSIIVISDYNKGTLSKLGNLDGILYHARKLGKIVLVDPKGLDFLIYQHASLLKPNYKEFTQIVGAIKDDQDFDAKAYSLIKKLDLNYLLITCGSDGMVLYGADKTKYTANSYANQVFDVTGAGDTVIASLAVSLSEQNLDDPDESKSSDFYFSDLCRAIERASHAAALAISKIGTNYVTRLELDEHIVKNGHSKKIYNKNPIQSESSIIYNWVIDTHKQDLKDMLSPRRIQDIISFKNINDQQRNCKLIVKISSSKNIDLNNTNNNNINYNFDQLAYIISQISVVDQVICE